MGELKEFMQYCGEKRIALLDNTAASFFYQHSCIGVDIEAVLRDYDIVLIPFWVMAEVKDSEGRKEYIEGLSKKGLPIRVVMEDTYASLVKLEEINLYEIFRAAAASMPELLRFLRQNVEKEDMLDMESFSAWQKLLYDNWPINNGPKSAEHKKNAGDISLVVLAEIFSWYYREIEILTIYTNDRDTYSFQKRAEKELKKIFCKRAHVPVTFKSDDAVFCQMYRENILSEENVRKLRKNDRYVSYIRQKTDKSIEMSTDKLTGEEFVDMLTDNTMQIIF